MAKEKQTSTRILILGGGFAGITAMHHLKKTLGHSVEVTVIDPRDHSLNKPRLPEVAIKGESIEHARFLMKSAVKSAGYALVQAKVSKIDPDEKKVFFEKGGHMSYDYLLITVGVEKDYSATPGFFEYGYSVCDDFQAPRLWRALQAYNGGPIAVGSAPFKAGSRVKAPTLKSPCEGPVGEIIFMLDHLLIEKGIRDKSPITVFTPGEVFFEDVGPSVHKDAKELLIKHNIDVVTNKTISRIAEGHVEFADGTQLPSNLTILIPRYKGNPLIEASGLGDEAGFIPTDQQMRHLDYPEIFAAGDATALSIPKLGHIAIMQSEIAAKMIARELGAKIDIPEFDPSILCIMNRGGHDATMIYSNHLYGGNIDAVLDGPIAHLMKWGFDVFYHYTRGHMAPKAAEELLQYYMSKNMG